MAVVALALIVAWILLVGGVRGVLAYRRTGEVPVRFADPSLSPQRWARMIASLGLLFAVTAPVAELIGLAPVALLDHSGVQLAGVALAVVGIGAALGAQFAMGDSWRADVDFDSQAALVTTGPFTIVRNPILTSTATTALGLTLAVPNVFSALMLVAFVIAYETQVRLVEEPHLLRVHGDAYRLYAARTGRFLPGIGRLRS